MKNILTLLFIIGAVTISTTCLSQIYPYAEGFEGLPSGQVPSGWGGSMKVLTYHGQLQQKAITARVNSAVLVDSGITPLIGPLTGSSVLTFYYRIVDYAFYPDGNATNLDAGDQVEVMLSTDGTSYQTVSLIDMNNHNPSFNFVKKKVFVTQWPGSNTYIKFRCQFATGNAFYVDIDTVQVRNDPTAGVDDLSNEPLVSIFPNPARDKVTVSGAYSLDGKTRLKIYDVLDNTIYSNPLTAATIQLSTTGWHRGIYFVEVGDERKRVTRKLIIQ